MKKTLLILLLIFGSNAFLAAQNKLHVFPDFQQPYVNHTRSKDGKTGSNYWQNKSDYHISAKVDPVLNQLEGSEHITYYNNSPDPLHKIVLRLYQNIYKKGSIRDYNFAASDITDGMQIKQLKIRNKLIDQSDPDDYQLSGTILTIALHQPLLPGDTLGVDATWNFHIPEKAYLRLGKGDSTSYFIGYWYPQISVYDDIHGWDMTKYTGLQEFYNDYSNFDVSIEVPAKYGVWATGLLQNPGEVYTKPFAKQVDAAFASDSVTHLITSQTYHNGPLPFDQTSTTNVWKFKARKVTDFAFSFSDHYLWDATGITMSDGRRIRVSAVYPKRAADFFEVATLARKAIDYYSNRLPGVPYPFPKMTVVQGKNQESTDGMEFPMMCNNPSAPDRGRTVDVTSHEIGHSYFPFYVGTNEHDYAWMDEAWAAMMPADYMKEEEPTSNRLTRYAHETSQQAKYRVMDLPVMTPSTALNRTNYFYLCYTKPAMAYNFLREELGDKLFIKALRGYIDRWKYKHPTPYDFFNSFNDISGRNLDWFWNSWFFEQYNPDLSISGVKTTRSGYEVIIKNKGGLPLPVALKLVYKDGRSEEVHKTVGVWKSNPSSIVIKAKKNLMKVVLGNDYIPDISPKNNVWMMGG